MDRFWGSYAPNRRMVAHLSKPGPGSAVVFGGLAVYLAWSMLRQVFVETLPPDVALGQTRLGFVLNAAFFALLIIFTAGMARRVHGIDPLRLLGDGTRFLGDFRRVLVATGGFYAGLVLLSGDFSGGEMRPLLGWLAFLPVAFVVIGIQTLAEEYLFRGYAHHFASVLLARPLAWMVIPSLLFGLTHVFNDLSSPLAAATYIATIFAFGLACVDLTARTGSLGAPWGLHLAYNMFAICLYAEEDGFMSGAALFLYPSLGGDGNGGAAPAGLLLLWTLQNLVFIGVLWLIARTAVRR